MATRKGCGICTKHLGKFQYKRIGLCNQCRRKVANALGKETRHVTLSEAQEAGFDADWYKNMDNKDDE